MKIALDFDGTVTEDSMLWYMFVKQAKKMGHEVKLVTFRSSDELTTDMQEFAEEAGIDIIFTARVFKHEHCLSIGWDPDVWIDDAPSLINHNDAPWTQEQHDEWKKTLSDRLVEERKGSGDSELPTLNTA